MNGVENVVRDTELVTTLLPEEAQRYVWAHHFIVGEGTQPLKQDYCIASDSHFNERKLSQRVLAGCVYGVTPSIRLHANFLFIRREAGAWNRWECTHTTQSEVMPRANNRSLHDFFDTQADFQLGSKNISLSGKYPFPQHCFLISYNTLLCI